MSEDIKTTNSIKTIVSSIVLVGSIALFYINPFLFEADLYKVLFLLLGVAIAIFIFLSSNDGDRLKTFLTQTKIELRKVVWPTKDETVKTTIMIIIAVFIVAIFLWLVDTFFSWMVSLLMS